MHVLFLVHCAHALTVGSLQAKPTTFTSSVPIAGLPFNIQINGLGFDKINDRMVIIESDKFCGTNPAEYDLAHFMNIPCDLPGSAPTVLQCGEVILSRRGEYTVCVCDSGTNSCDEISHYSNGGRWNGVFALHGPIAETHTLRAGVAGIVLILGQQFHSRDRFRILSATASCSDQAVQNVEELLEGGVSQRDAGGNDYSRWNNVVLGGGANEYTLCWCSGMVETCSDDMYTVPFGTLVVDGPDLRPTVQWTTGLVNVIHLYGTGLADTDRIRIRFGDHECGDHSSGKHSTGVLIKPSDPRNAGDGVASHWGTVTIALRGDYVVCWCGREAGVCTDCCEMDQHFNILAANIHVVGPLQGIFVQGIVGRAFRFNMTNTLPGLQDRIRLVGSFDACTSADTPPTVFKNPVGPPQIDGFTQAWEMVVAYQSLVKVCWCPEDSNCFDIDDFTVEVGLIEFVGPQWKEVNIIKHAPFTLSVSSRKMSTGQSVLHSLDRFRIVNYDVVQCGKFGSDENTGSLATEICWPQCNPTPVDGNPTSLTDTTEEWEPLMLTNMGKFRVCWCPNVNNCTKMEDFNAFVMTLNVVGVDKDQSFSCASMENCKVAVKAGGGLQVTDHIQLIAVEPLKFCGRTEQTSVNFFEYGSRLIASPPPDPDQSVDQEISFDLGKALEPGVYHVCYCQSHEDCSDDVHYFQNAGMLRVAGIAQGDHVHMCYMKTQCQVNLVGTLLSPSSDALMIYNEHAECGTNSNTYGSYFRNKAFPLTDGGFKFLGEQGPLQNDLVTAMMHLGLPIRAGTYRMCYCDHRQAQGSFCLSRTDFRLPSGYLRIGGVEFQAQVTCMQGEQCDVGLVGNFGDDDMILIIHYSNEVMCGDPLSEPATGFGWNPASSTEGVKVNSEKNDRLELRFNLPRVDKPGRFRICFCGKVGHDACKIDEWWQFPHDAGVLNVLGVIHEIRPYLLATPRVVSVEVETVVGGGGIHCSVSDRGSLDYYTVPTTDELIDCQNEDVRRGPTEAPMPLCIARASLEGFAIVGTNIVHIPLTGFPTEKVHVWCYTDMFCQSKRCVSPPTSDGLIVNIEGSLRGNSDFMVTSVGMPFNLKLETMAPPEDVRIKIVEMSGSCSMQEMSLQVLGLTCLVGALGKCDPAPEALQGTEVVWQDLLVNVPNSYQICYCDRHYDATCLLWEESGRIEAQGPSGQPSLQSNPGSELIIGLHGRGFAIGDRVRILEENVGCFVPEVVTPAPNATNSSRRLAAVWQSGAPMAQNTTYEEWRVRLDMLGYYTLCWCGESAGSVHCENPTNYRLNAGSIHVAERKDCIMSEVIVVEQCTMPCGGGVRKEKQRIISEAKGGGVSCASDAEEVKGVSCNEDPCPLARLDEAVFDPPSPVQGEAFTATLHGMYLSNEDRLLIVEKTVQCGQEATHAGGSTCKVVNRMDDGLGNILQCGDGMRSIMLQKPGDYRLCFCDATAAILRNADGTGGVGASPMTSSNVFSAGCAATVAYVLSPTKNAEFTVLRRVDPEAQNIVCSSFNHAANCALYNQCTWQEDRCKAFESKILGMPQAVFVTTCCIVGVGIIILFLLAWWYHRRRRPEQYLDMDKMASASGGPQPSPDDLRAAQDHYQLMQYWDNYYQSLGYPPGTAWIIHGQEGQTMEQLEDAPMNSYVDPMNALTDGSVDQNMSGTWGDVLKNLQLPPPPTGRGSVSNTPRQTPVGSKFSDRVRRAAVAVDNTSTTSARILSSKPPPNPPPSPPKKKFAQIPQFAQSPPKPPEAAAPPPMLALENGQPPPFLDKTPLPSGEQPLSKKSHRGKAPVSDIDGDSLALSTDSDQTPRFHSPPTQGDAVVLDVAASPTSKPTKQVVVKKNHGELKNTQQRRRKVAPEGASAVDPALKSALGIGQVDFGQLEAPTPSSPSSAGHPNPKPPKPHLSATKSSSADVTLGGQDSPPIQATPILEKRRVPPSPPLTGGAIPPSSEAAHDPPVVDSGSPTRLNAPPVFPPQADPLDATLGNASRLPKPPPGASWKQKNMPPEIELEAVIDPHDMTIRSDVSLYVVPNSKSPQNKPKPPDFGSSVASGSLPRRPPPPPPPGGQSASSMGRRPLPPPPSGRKKEMDSHVTEEAVTSPTNGPKKISLGGSAARSNAVSVVGKPAQSPKHLPGRVPSPSNALVMRKPSS